MAVSKELYERYKQLKAQGVSISLSELKQQMESEAQQTNSVHQVVNNVATENSQPETQNTPVFSHNYSAQNNQATSYNSPNQTNLSNSYNQPSQPQNNYESHNVSYTNQDANINSNSNQYSSNNASSSVFGSQNSIQNDQTKPAEVSSNSSWTTTYSKPSVDTNSEVYKNYSNSFNSNFSTQSSGLENNNNYLSSNSFDSYSGSMSSNTITQSQTISGTQSSSQTHKYTGNLSEEKIQAAVSETKNLNKYCVIGYPLGHSLSTYIHNAGFKSLGIDATYDILETPPDTLVDRVKYLKNNGFAGFNVTIPLKLPITLFLDKIDPSADIVGAVNTVVINPDKTMVGYNTDVIGFRDAIPSDIILAGKTAGVLGTGGAARAAITALAQNQVKQIKIFTRNIPNSLELLNFLRNKFQKVEFHAFQIERIRDLSDVQILVNTTPIGMQGRAADMTPVEENELRTLPSGAIVYDVIYNPKKTLLLKLAQKNGYRTINGVDMFIYQAAAAEKIWTGRVPDFKDMKIAALENL